MPPFFVVTRLGIGIHNEAWYRRTLSLFEAVTFPSLCAQSCQDFTVLLVIDPDMPSDVRRRLASILEGHANFHIVPLDLTEMRHVHVGGFDYVWDRCQDYVLGRRLVVDPFDYEITAVLDGDDAWHRDTVALVRERVTPEIPGFIAAEQHRHTWIRHSSGMLLSFANGLEWYAGPDVIQSMHHPFWSMGNFIVARFSSGLSACSSRHHAWPSFCNVTMFRTVIAETSHPMWVYVRHDRSELPWQASEKSSNQQSIGQLHRDFGIDFDKVEQWRGAQASGDTMASASHSGMWGTEQLDCYFRITALNRQIDALERAAPENGDADAALLASQRALKAELQRQFRERAMHHFG